jgi:hypothetical protein
MFQDIAKMVHKALYFLFGGTGDSIDRTALWTGVAAIAAFVAIFIAWLELGSTRKTTHADFVKRFNDSFFNQETRTLFTLLMNSALEFNVLEIKGKDGQQIDRLPYFKIKKDIANQLKGIVSIDPEKTGYSAFEIDDFLLGYFDDIGWYRKGRIIDLDSIEQTFGYYVIACYENEEIQKYLNDEDNKCKYSDFKFIYDKLKKD